MIVGDSAGAGGRELLAGDADRTYDGAMLTARTDAAPAANEVGETLPITVVIPAHNRARLLASALLSVLAQAPRLPAEVIVVDDGSDDDSVAVAERLGARVIRHEERRGAA